MLATRRLPVGEVRLRYRLEMLAELWGTPARRQASYAWGTLCASRSLVRAVRHPDPAAQTRRPLACRLHLHHRWHVVSTEEGISRWQECALRPRPGAGQSQHRHDHARSLVVRRLPGGM